MRNLLTVIFALSLFTFTAHAALATHTEPMLSRSEIREIVCNTINFLEHEYLFPEQASGASEELLRILESSEIHQALPFGMFKQKFEHTLINTTGDTGFELTLREQYNPLDTNIEKQQEYVIQTEKLAKEIGYIRLHGDFLYSTSMREFDSAMTHLATSKALIIDLREAGLGTLPIATHILRFILKPNMVLAHVYLNPGASPALILSPADSPPSPAFFAKPVFILHSNFVAGPWEFLSYTLKHHQAAVIVGEDTMGVALMKKTLTVSEHTNLTLHYAQTSHPQTQDNWLKYGVIADHQVSAEQSLSTAIALAKHQLSKKE